MARPLPIKSVRFLCHKLCPGRKVSKRRDAGLLQLRPGRGRGARGQREEQEQEGVGAQDVLLPTGSNRV